MTLLGLVELSHTPKRAVRGLVLSVFACPRACAQLGPAARIARIKTSAAITRLFTRINVPPYERRSNTISIVHLCLSAKRQQDRSRRSRVTPIRRAIRDGASLLRCR